MNKRPFRLFSLILIIALLAALPGMHADAQTQPTIRVWLKRLGVQDTLRIQVQGSYMLEDGSMTFADGAELSISARGEQLVLHSGQVAVALGNSAVLVRCNDDMPSALLLNGNSGLYEGDLHLSIKDGNVHPILHIFIEDYLLGVVPYEMGDSFPLEALKAQAIAARTYALRKSGGSDDYDVEDTTNDQAYKGRSSSSPLSEQAVRDTKGLVGTYRGKLAQCYYSASNGGQTDLGVNVWPDEDPDKYGYMDMRDDPYDYENEASSVKRYTLMKKPGNMGVGVPLHSEIVKALTQPLALLGHEAEDDLVRIDEIVGVEMQTPKFDAPSRLMTEMVLDLRISVRDCLFRNQTTAEMNEADYTPAPYATPSPTPRPTDTPAYAPYEKLDQVFTIVLPVFTAVEKAMGLSINVYQNELITASDIGNAYMIESRRYGHGVGMSQRGAQQMAKEYGMTYEEILKFYYPRLTVASYDVRRVALPTIDVSLMATPAPTPSPTPRPTLMPVSDEALPKGAYIAVVANIDDDSSLNLRQYPSLSSDIMRRLYKNQRLIVLSTDQNGWSHVKTDVIEGYVKNEYLQTEEK